MASSKDPITGLRISIDGIGRIRSGRIYADDLIAKNTIDNVDYWASDHQKARIQWQFGRNYIVITEDASDIDNSVRRWVCEGKFEYARGSISKANVETVHDIYMISDQRLDSNDEGFRAERRNGWEIAKPGKIDSWMSVLGDLEESKYDTGNYHGDDKGWSQFKNYASGRFFANMWEQNPFSFISDI